ncbi:MAG: DNA replication/repair protein RecF [Thermaurantiacus sp.]
MPSPPAPLASRRSPRISALSLSSVRNHRETRLAPGDAAFVVLTGPNGAGKTAVLEAVSLLAPGRGLRAASLGEIARADGGGGFAVRAALALEPELPPVMLATGTDAASPERRQLKVNGAPAALASLADWLSLLWITPAMDRLFQDSPGARRRFLDRLVLARLPAHGGHATRYEAAMRERTRLLTGDRPADPAWLDALEAQMARHGAGLARARAETAARLGERIATSADPAFPAAALALEGEDWQAEEALRAALAAARARDVAAGRATQGPHKVDLAVTLAASGVPAARASTGEQKALLAGLMLAHAALVAEERGRAPVLLFDEVAAHLDPVRLAALFARIAALGGQCWLTGTEPGLFGQLPALALRASILDGALVRAEIA